MAATFQGFVQWFWVKAWPNFAVGYGCYDDGTDPDYWGINTLNDVKHNF